MGRQVEDEEPREPLTPGERGRKRGETERGRKGKMNKGSHENSPSEGGEKKGERNKAKD